MQGVYISNNGSANKPACFGKFDNAPPCQKCGFKKMCIGETRSKEDEV